MRIKPQTGTGKPLFNWDWSRKKVSSAINIAEVYTKYNVGRYIIEHEQEEKYKAVYGKQVLKQLSEKLTNRYGKG